MGEKHVKTSLVKVLPVRLLHGEQLFGRLKLGLVVGQRETIVWANILANVATINPVVEFRLVEAFQTTLVLDSQVRDALARVDAEWCFQSASGTGIDALRTTPATVWQFSASFS